MNFLVEAVNSVASYSPMAKCLKTIQETNSLQQYRYAIYYPFTETNPAPVISSTENLSFVVPQTVSGDTQILSPNETTIPTAQQFSTTVQPVKSVRIAIVEEDCLLVTGRLATSEMHFKPAVLNMANSYNCGGGFCTSRGSQEEYIFRNSTLVCSLWPHRRPDDVRWEVAEEVIPRDVQENGIANAFYPLTDCGGIYSPCVQVFSLSDKLLPEEKRFECSVLTIAAQDLRWRSDLYKAPKFNYELTVKKFRTMLHMALVNGHKSLVLGAIGCGAFLNPPDAIASAFEELLGPQGEFHHSFDLIIFSIIFSKPNLQAFENRFGQKIPLDQLLDPNISHLDSNVKTEES
eukprot:gene12708-17044_t